MLYLKTAHLELNTMEILDISISLEKFPQPNNAVFIAFDLPNNAKWEFNTGPGLGLTNSTDRLVFKTIPGRRINWHAKFHP
jgi:hypothetical protein